MSNSSGSDGGGGREHPLLALPREDLDLIAELVLQSGSLKGLARSYSVSYPTIRVRVNKVIARLRDAVEGREPDPLRELLASLVARGELTTAGARRIHAAAQQSEGQATHSNKGDQS